MSSSQAKVGAKGLRTILGGAFLVLFLFGYSVPAMAQTSLGQVTVPKVIAHYPELILYNACRMSNGKNLHVVMIWN